MSYVRYPLSFKLKIVAEVVLNEEKKGIQSKIADKYGISKFSVSNWVKQYRDMVKQSNDKINAESKPTDTMMNKMLEENEALKSIIIQKELEIKKIKNKYKLKQQTPINGLV